MASIENDLSYALNHSIDLEFSVIGAVLIEPRFLDKVAGKLHSEDFVSPLCAQIWNEAIAQRNNGKVLDFVLAEDIVRPSVPDAKEWIKSCMTMCPSAASAEYHAELISAAAKDRRFRESVREALEKQSGDKLAVEIAGLCQDLIQGKQGRSRTLAEVLDRTLDKMNSPQQDRLYTGYKRLDGLMKGMRDGNLIIVAARPSVGKSVFAQNLAENVAATSGKKVLLYSLEMSDIELGERWLSANSGISLEKISDADLEDEEFIKVTEACRTLYPLNLIINDDTGITAAKIRAEARTTDNLGLIVIDFLTLMRSERRFDNRNLEVGAISRELKLLAKELKIPIIVLAQLSRKVSDTDKPSLGDLRDSGEIEQNADKVIFLWKANEEEDIRGVGIAKNRQGRCGDIQMAFDGEHMRFMELARDQEVWSKPKAKSSNRGRWEDDD